MKGKLLSGLLVLALLSLSLISAKSVDRWVSIDVDEHYTLVANTPENPCDFDIDWSFVGSQFFIGWFDENGYLVKLHIVLNKINESFSANGKSLPLKGITIHYSVLPDGRLAETYLGVSGFTPLPGYGPVWGSAGQMTIVYTFDPLTEEVISTEVTKNVGVLRYDDFYPVCEYLTP